MNILRAPVTSSCAVCGIPIDSQYFDTVGFQPLPNPGDQVLLAQFQLPAQYCGILEGFSQFTDRFFTNPSEVETVGLEWRLLVDGRPLNPYTTVEAILNPWGVGSYPVRIRLPEGARLEFTLRRRPGAASSGIARVGGRISGRYWFPND